MRDVERGHHRNALDTGDLARIANLAHALIQEVHGFDQFGALLFPARDFIFTAEHGHVERDGPIGRLRCRGKQSGIDVDSPAAWVFTFRDLKATRMRVYLDPEEAVGEFNTASGVAPSGSPTAAAKASPGQRSMAPLLWIVLMLAFWQVDKTEPMSVWAYAASWVLAAAGGWFFWTRLSRRFAKEPAEDGLTAALIKYGGGLERKRWLLQHEGVEV